MGIREDQIIGLNPWAESLVNKSIKALESGETIFPDGKKIPFAREVFVPEVKKEVYAHFDGMYDNKYPLYKHILPDNTVYFEYVQAAPWSSGPCFFLALKDKTGKPIRESLWSEEDIQNA